jgi:hypothetical protein
VKWLEYRGAEPCLKIAYANLFYHVQDERGVHPVHICQIFHGKRRGTLNVELTGLLNVQLLTWYGPRALYTIVQPSKAQPS